MTLAAARCRVWDGSDSRRPHRSWATAPTGRPGDRLDGRLAVPCAAVAGLLLDAAFPSLGWWPLAWVSVVVVLVCLVGRSGGGALLIGSVYGLSFYLAHLRWVAEFAGPLPWLALVALQTILIAAMSVLITVTYRWSDQGLRSRSARLVLVPALVAGVWTLRETVMEAWPYGGFGWARLAVSQVDGPAAQSLSWVGATGLSFLMVAVCASVLQTIRLAAVNDVCALIPAALAVLLLAGPQFPTTPAGQLRVGWVQGNGPTGYFDNREPGDVLAAQTAASTAIQGQPTDLLVWPEGGVDSDPLNSLGTAAALDDMVERTGAPLLVNAATARDGRSYNTSLLWTSAGATQLYDKINPVPFGEYVPDRWLYERLAPDLIELIQRDYTPGTRPPIAVVNGVVVALAICFDVIDDDVIGDGIRRGARVFVFQSNNADFRGTDENLQQLAFARLRAIETGRSAVNVSTVGASQVITPTGLVIDEAGVDQVAARVTTVPLYTGLTPATVIGSRLAPLIAWGTLIALAGLRLTVARRHRSGRKGISR